jgi:alpha-1,6-mannosyltransferase
VSTRSAALLACGAILVALTVTGLLFQLENRLDHFLIVAALQSAVYAIAVGTTWNGGSSRRMVLAIVAVAITMRIAVAPAPPYLSSDIYRYVWDGHIEAAGFNPYRYAPTDTRLDALRDQRIYPEIASKDAPTIYPPFAEGIFLAVTRIHESATALKIAMAICDVITFFLLMRLLALEGLPTARVLIYAWHPLPLWEFAGSGHIDAVLIVCLLGALYAARRRRTGLSGLLLAAATLTKFYPAVVAPALYRRWGWRMPALFAAAIIAAYLPFVSAGPHVLGFLPGYAHQEGFDDAGAGFYLLDLLRHVPALASLTARGYAAGAVVVLAALGIAVAFRRDRDRSPYAAAATLAALFMVFVSPHYPWYFSWLIVFACFVRSSALLWLTNACLLLYLVTGYVFLPSFQLLAIESLIYGPFAALALVDVWCHRRAAISSASRPRAERSR